MRKFFLLALAAMCAMEVLALAPELTYNGTVLPWNTEFTRTQCGTLKKDVIIPEISGIACSRVTPGYIWMQSDDYSDCIVATTEEGQTRNMLVNFTSVIRNDWEDMCGGVYNGKNYLFIGAIGDNNTNKGNYYIVYFEEPAITSGSKSITPSYIKFQYSDGKNHNAESLMYDPKEEMLYIVTKVYYNVNQVFKMPFRLDYGETVQTFQYVCDLGIKSDMGPGENPSKGFHLATAADISPDGKYVLIKNHNNTDTCSQYSWILMWERQGEESISETIKRQPQPLACYEHEWQGEAICWLDDNTFYTTSDDDGNPPVYKYTRNGGSVAPEPEPAVKKNITIDGNFEDWADLKGLAHAEVHSYSEKKELYDMRWYAEGDDIFFYLEFSSLVVPIDILLSTDDNDLTGHTSYLWSGNTAFDYLIEEENIANHFSDASFTAFNNTVDQINWSWLETDVVNFITACNTATLTNGHKAIEGKITASKIPTPIVKLKVGVFTSNSGWTENGVLPDDALLEVPFYQEPTGMDQLTIEDERSTEKILIDGQLYIRHGNTIYTITGQEIR